MAPLRPLRYAVCMSEAGGFESFQPGEGQTAASEALSEEARQRFAAAAQQLKQIAREEKRAKRRDDRVARTIIQFLNDDKHTHLFLLISRLVARDCPSIFILSLLSLIHQPSLETVEEYVRDRHVQIELPSSKGISLMKDGSLPPDANEKLISWISRLQLVMSIDGDSILKKLLIDAHNIDGSVLQLTTFILIEFFQSIDRAAPYEKLQPLTVNILQTILEPHIAQIEQYFLGEKNNTGNDDETP